MHNRIVLLVCILSALFIGCAYSEAPSLKGGITKAVPVEGICDSLPQITYPNVVECRPGEITPAICVGGGLSGYRVCNDNGVSRTRTEGCPEWTYGINQEAPWLLVARKPGYIPGIGDIVAQNKGVMVYLEDFVDGFPMPTLPESQREGIRHLWLNELPHLKDVVILGEATHGVKENARDLSELGVFETPLWYFQTPDGMANLDWWIETTIPSAIPFGYLRGELPVKVGTRFWTPEIFDLDVNVTYLPFNSTDICDSETGSCLKDLQVFAQKLISHEAPGAFIESQFDGAKCHGEDWGVQRDNDIHNGVTHQIKVHACQGGESGLMGPFAQADNADYAFFGWHGGPAGSCDPEAYCFDWSYNGSAGITGTSCSIMSPNSEETPLAAFLLRNPNGPLWVTGSSRVAAIGAYNPINRAFIAGRWDVGDIVYGQMRDTMDTLPARHAVKDVLGIMLHGDPNMGVIKPPSKWLRTLKSRKNADGSVNACVQVAGAHSVGGTHLRVAGTNITSTPLHVRSTVLVNATIPAHLATDRNVISMSTCNTAVESCQVAALKPERYTRLTCGNLQRNTDGTAGVSIGSTHWMTGKLYFAVYVVNYECMNNPESDCYLDQWPDARREYLIESQKVDVIEAGEVEKFNHLSFDLYQPTENPNEVFRAIEIKVLGENPENVDIYGEEYASCYVPLDELDAEYWDLY